MVAGHFKKFLAAGWSFIGIILFFIVHGYSRNQTLVPLPQLFFLLMILLLTGIVLQLIFTRIYRNTQNANLFTSFVLICVLFFGVFQEFLEQFRVTSVLGRLVVLAPLSLLVIVLVFVWLKRSGRNLTKVTTYLNVLVLIYVLVDVGIIVGGRSEKQEVLADKNGLIKCDTCARPPVYLILLDSYFGSEGMRQFFHYNNDAFENSLRKEGFHINNNSRSNYYSTVYSMASLLNMDYLGDIGTLNYRDHYAFTRATEAIQQNSVTRFFASQGYTIHNFSDFEIEGAPAHADFNLLPGKINLVTTQTLFYRINKYLPPFLVRQGWQSPEKAENEHLDRLQEIMCRSLPDSNATSSKPAFTYVHLLMPHDPYLFDSLGNRMSLGKVPSTGATYNMDEQFLQYQVFSHKKIAEYITQLKKRTEGKAVILLMSDHGYPYTLQVDKKLAYYNLNALYLPNGDYTGWYDGISNVNQFRVLFNRLFQQKLPMLKDSIVLP